MKWSSVTGYFLTGAALTNSAPHLIIALTGRRNLTPFGRDSSAQVNLLWSVINIILGYLFMRFADKRAGAKANSPAWLLPYEAGTLFWGLFGVLYALRLVKRASQNERELLTAR
jgi:hypothetical protein